MLTYTDAQKILNSFARSYGKEKLLLDDAVDRVLAEDVFADRDYPPFNRVAMDGYALRFDDLRRGITEFEVIDAIYAGGTTEKVLSTGQCYKIMTGAACPLSANVVIRKEDSQSNGNKVSFLVADIRSFQNIARKGEDLQKGNRVLTKGTKCTPSAIGVLASLGYSEVEAEKLPSIAIITTGNEVVAVKQAITDVQIRNSNWHVLKALLRRHSLAPTFYRHVPDDKEQLVQTLSEALQYDIVILSGGVSAGDADYVPDVLQSLGVQSLFHKLAIKPGKPIWCGHKENQTMVFALPGNPFSCVVTFTLFVRYYLECCFGLESSFLSLPLPAGRRQKVKLDEFFPVRIEGNPSVFAPVTLNGSGDIRIGLGADALALHPAHQPEIGRGEIVTGILL